LTGSNKDHEQQIVVVVVDTSKDEGRVEAYCAVQNELMVTTPVVL